MIRRTLTLLLVGLVALFSSSAFAQKRGSRNQAAPKTKMTTSTKVATVLEPSRSPLVSFRILFMTGSASDPAGKEGVASLTAAMLAQGTEVIYTTPEEFDRFQRAEIAKWGKVIRDANIRAE